MSGNWAGLPRGLTKGSPFAIVNKYQHAPAAGIVRRQRMARNDLSAKKRKVEMVKCNKCGFDAAPEAKFCPNCGARLFVARAPSQKALEGLAFLHLAGGAYVLITAMANTLVQASLLFLVPYILVGVLGLFVGGQFYTRKVAGRWTKGLSLAVVIIGLAVTISVYVVGLGRLVGVIGPAWIIFAFTGWALVKEWRTL